MPSNYDFINKDFVENLTNYFGLQDYPKDLKKFYLMLRMVFPTFDVTNLLETPTPFEVTLDLETPALNTPVAVFTVPANKRYRLIHWWREATTVNTQLGISGTGISNVIYISLVGTNYEYKTYDKGLPLLPGQALNIMATNDVGDAARAVRGFYIEQDDFGS